MKKTITVLLSTFMILSLAACGNSANRTEQPAAEDNLAETDISDGADSVEEGIGDDLNSVEAAADSGADSGSVEENTNDDAVWENSSADNMENAEETDAQQGEGEALQEQGTKVLVAYFSATNTTKGVAEQIADGLQADLYEIVPEEPYTDADLNYNDNNSRTTIEMNDPDVRPAISGSVENMEAYEVIFIGYAGGIIGLNQEKPINQGFALV